MYRCRKCSVPVYVLTVTGVSMAFTLPNHVATELLQEVDRGLELQPRRVLRSAGYL
jgi:hypothetical protein